jgi:arylformamidase
VRPIDISMPIFAGMPAFPGDPRVVSEPLRRVARGDAYNLSLLTVGSHVGTHVDPPSHFLDGGPSAEELDLAALNGRCEVLGVPAGCRSVGSEEAARLPPGTRRVLLRTANSARWAERLEFFEDYVGLSIEGARAFADAGVRLVGIDALSVESDPTGRFPVHRELLGRGIPILEGLLLEAATPGPYELSCLPLALRGGDGAPARAVLWAP